jgi:hypothetical protein
MTDDDLEQALADTLAQRAASIQTTPTYDLVSAPARTGGPRGAIMLTGIAAAAVLAVVVTLLVVRSGPSDQPTGRTTSTASEPAPSTSPTNVAITRTCVVSTKDLDALIAGSRIRVDQPRNVAVGTGPDGAVLLMQSAVAAAPGQSEGLRHNELAIFDRAGRGRTVWTAADPATDIADVDPAAAVSANWVVLGTRRGQQLADRQIFGWNRSTGQLQAIPPLNGVPLADDDSLSVPIVIGNVAYWIQQRYGQPSTQTVVSYNLAEHKQTSATPTANISQLLAAHGQVAFVSSGGNSQRLTSSPGVAVPLVTEQASDQGTSFTSDGTTISWLDNKTMTTGTAIASWRPGESSVIFTLLGSWLSRVRALAGPYVSAGEDAAPVLIDADHARAIRLPATASIDVIAGTDAIITTGGDKFGATTVARIDVGKLVSACR